MGSFTLTIINPDKGKNNANGLKILTFILYYVYYNTNLSDIKVYKILEHMILNILDYNSKN
jgi:hypothetical protein